jgi:hypothetical protein
MRKVVRAEPIPLEWHPKYRYNPFKRIKSFAKKP